LCTAGPRSDHEYPDNSVVLNAAKQYPGILFPFAFVDLWDKDIQPETIDRFAEQGFRGLKCITPYYAYDDDLYMPVYERAERLGLPILFHTGSYRGNRHDVVNRRPMLKNMHPLTLDRIARSFPELKIVMAHMGTTFFRREAAELVKLHKNIYADLAGCGSWMAIQPGELLSLLGSSIVEVDVSFAGFKKLILGSDAYVTVPRIMTEAQKYYEVLLERIGVPPEITAGIMGGTAAGWLE
ncbi:MAG: amidohydrolase, partial [Lentisphaeria bacterium]|nr:amidohydrolase [Lentisphaeria bacterium]